MPRKFAEKIALLNKKEREGNAAFERIIREVESSTRLPSSTSSLPSHIGAGVKSFQSHRQAAFPYQYHPQHQHQHPHQQHQNQHQLQHQQHQQPWPPGEQLQHQQQQQQGPYVQYVIHQQPTVSQSQMDPAQNGPNELNAYVQQEQQPQQQQQRTRTQYNHQHYLGQYGQPARHHQSQERLHPPPSQPSFQGSDAATMGIIGNMHDVPNIQISQIEDSSDTDFYNEHQQPPQQNQQQVASRSSTNSSVGPISSNGSCYNYVLDAGDMFSTRSTTTNLCSSGISAARSLPDIANLRLAGGCNGDKSPVGGAAGQNNMAEGLGGCVTMPRSNGLLSSNHQQEQQTNNLHQQHHSRSNHVSPCSSPGSHHRQQQQQQQPHQQQQQPIYDEQHLLLQTSLPTTVTDCNNHYATTIHTTTYGSQSALHNHNGSSSTTASSPLTAASTNSASTFDMAHNNLSPPSYANSPTSSSTPAATAPGHHQTTNNQHNSTTSMTNSNNNNNSNHQHHHPQDRHQDLYTSPHLSPAESSPGGSVGGGGGGIGPSPLASDPHDTAQLWRQTSPQQQHQQHGLDFNHNLHSLSPPPNLHHQEYEDDYRGNGTIVRANSTNAVLSGWQGFDLLNAPTVNGNLSKSFETCHPSYQLDDR